MPDIFALDTNVLVYLHDSSNVHKREIAKQLLSNSPKISSHVVSEYVNTCRRLLTLDKTSLLLQTAALLSNCQIIAVQPATLAYAAQLTEKYKLQIFDAIIVANCIEGNCNVLYSEGMHHQLLVDKRIKIINPFI
jgi:predicted nucleic acid-binding protein